jgi:hypothetical protein
MSRMILVKAIFDSEAGVWFTDSSDLHGLRIEAATLEILIERIPGAVLDLLDDGDPDDTTAVEIPIEIVAHASTRARVHEAA